MASRTRRFLQQFLMSSRRVFPLMLLAAFLTFGRSVAEAALSSPSSLTATAISSNQINLTWLDNSTNESGFKIERAPAPTGPWTQIATTGVSVTAYANTGLSAAATYYYRVRAYKAAGGSSSSYSNTASATTPAGSDTTAPSVPTGPTATAAYRLLTRSASALTRLTST